MEDERIGPLDREEAGRLVTMEFLYPDGEQNTSNHREEVDRKKRKRE
jgi:hypothetical protein